MPFKDNDTELLQYNSSLAVTDPQNLFKWTLKLEEAIKTYDTTFHQYMVFSRAEIALEKAALINTSLKKVMRKDFITTKLNVLFDASSHEGNNHNSSF